MIILIYFGNLNPFTWSQIANYALILDHLRIKKKH